jgi:hypothetical protein
MEGDGLTINGGPDPFNLEPPAPPPPETPPASDAPAKQPWETAIESLAGTVTTLADSVKELKDRPASVPAMDQPTRGVPGDTSGGGPLGGGVSTIALELQNLMQTGAIKTVAELEAFWDRQFMQNPGKAMVAQQQINQAQAEFIAQKSGSGVREQQGYTAIDNFKRDKFANADPMFLNPDVRAEFDALIEKNKPNIGRMSLQEIHEGLDSVFDIAIGRVARKRASGSSADARLGRDNAPPQYPRSSGGGFGTSREATQLTDMTPRNEVEKQILATARELNFSDAEIQAALKANREEIA